MPTKSGSRRPPKQADKEAVTRVVSSGKPLRIVVGDLISHTVMPISISTMHVKNTATGNVQAIQSNICTF